MNNENPRFREASAATSLKREVCRSKTGNVASTSISQFAHEWRRKNILSCVYSKWDNEILIKENITSATYNEAKALVVVTRSKYIRR